jgi:hypothetical protein
VNYIVSLAPYDLGEATPSNGGSQKEFDRNFDWEDYLTRNLSKAFQMTIDAARLPDMDQTGKKSLTIIDDVLLELVGYMKIRNMQLPSVTVAN